MPEIPSNSPKIALMLPCLNEELTLAKVIEDFRAEIPRLEVYVFDNGSSDRSQKIAEDSGAYVISVPQRGKGQVVRRMFEMVEADFYILVDSDDTYDASRIHDLLQPVTTGQADMVVATRLNVSTSLAFRKFHRFGNNLILKLINLIFRSHLTDILSGYRVMNRNFVKNIPFLRQGFEIETELTVYSLINGYQIKEIPVSYRERPPHSFSKLRTFSDGYKVLLTIVWLVRDLRPLLFFASLSLLMFAMGLLPAWLLFPEQKMLQVLLVVLISNLMSTGLILNTFHVRFQELQLLNRRQSYRPVQPLKAKPVTKLDLMLDNSAELESLTV